MITISLDGAGDIPAVSNISFSVRYVSWFSHLQMFLWHTQSLSLTSVKQQISCDEEEMQETALLRIWSPFSSLSHFKLPPFCFLWFFSAKFYLGDFQSRTPWSNSTGAGTAHVCCYLSKMVKAKNSRHILGGDGEKIGNSFIIFF